MLLPTFIVIGAAKTGTTSLYHYLAEHPDVWMSPEKETNFFVQETREEGLSRFGRFVLRHRYPARTLEEYAALFAGARHDQARGEASPAYFDNPVAARCIAEVIPRARLVAGLRDPAERAWSGYLMHVRQGVAGADLERAFTRGRPWIEGGFYQRHLSRYLEHFDREQLHVYLFDELATDPVRTVQDIYRFIGVGDDHVPQVDTVHNVGTYPRRQGFHRLFGSPRLRGYARQFIPRTLVDHAKRLRDANLAEPPPLPADVRARLVALYRDDIEATGQLIGRDLSRWLQVDAARL